MKLTTTTLALVLFAGTLTLNAQTKQDSILIENACRNYIEGWETADTARISLGISTDLVKRSIYKNNDGSSYIFVMTPDDLKQAALENSNGVQLEDLNPGSPSKLIVEIHNITGDFALVHAYNKKYGLFDYCQLAKFNGEWKVFNVMWGFIPQE